MKIATQVKRLSVANATVACVSARTCWTDCDLAFCE
jgi:hypothetical protein